MSVTFDIEALLLAGISIGVVFAILIVLVFVLNIFGWVAKRAVTKAAPAAKPAVKQTETVSIADANDIDKVAIATALYLYMNDMHDEESGLLTIAHNDLTAWHAELNHSIHEF